MSKSRKIGVPATCKNGMIGVNYQYIEFAKKYGEVVLLLPTDKHIQRDLDLLILPGGPDVDTRRYRQEPDPTTGKPDIFMEYFDTEVLPRYISAGVPIFGIN